MEKTYIAQNTPVYRRAIVMLFLGSLAAFGAEYCLQPIIPVLAQEFQLTPATASLAMSFGTGGMAFAMLAIASLARRLARKQTMTVAIAVASLLAVGMAVSQNFGLILCLRLCQGVLLAGFPALALAYINEEFDPKIVGLAVGIYVSGSSLGGLFGRLMISTATDYFSWRYALGAAGVFYFAISLLFWFGLPAPQHKLEAGGGRPSLRSDLWRLLQNWRLLGIYTVAFAAMGAFVCTYNYITYVLIAPPYSLSQTAIGFVFSIYLIGTLASTLMGGFSDRYGNGRILVISLLLMLAGILTTLGAPLFVKIAGLALFTYGFFGAHCTACGWAGKIARGDKAQASSMYMLFYYVGASVVGTIGGTFLSSHGWEGVVFLITALLGASLLLALRLALPDFAALQARLKSH